MYYDTLSILEYSGNIQVTKVSPVFFIGQELKESCVEWFTSQSSVSVTADIGTMSGLTQITVILISDKTGETKLAGFRLIPCKDGDFCAEQIYLIMTQDLGEYIIFVLL